MWLVQCHRHPGRERNLRVISYIIYSHKKFNLHFLASFLKIDAAVNLLKLTQNDRFSRNFIIQQEESTERKSPQKYFQIFILIFDLEFEPWPYVQLVNTLSTRLRRLQLERNEIFLKATSSHSVCLQFSGKIAMKKFLQKFYDQEQTLNSRSYHLQINLAPTI